MGGRSKDGSAAKILKKEIAEHKSLQEVIDDFKVNLAITTGLLGAKEFTHILDGEEGNFLGGHRSGIGNKDKTEFPPSWSDEDIIQAVLTTELNPDKDITVGNIRFRLKEVNRVVIEMKTHISKSGEKLGHAYPKSGDGVIMNTKNVPIEMPLNREQLK